MPQASEELRAKFPGSDQQAFEVIRNNFDVSRAGMICPKVQGYKPTAEEWDAIDYLFYEWDYGYRP